MEKLKYVLKKLLSEKTTINWLIVHEVSKLANDIEGIYFSYVDGEEKFDKPFKTNQGYISFKNPLSVTDLEKIVRELTAEFKLNSFALANLFIIVTRTNYNEVQQETLIKSFKKTLGKVVCHKIYNLFIDSLNIEYDLHKQSSTSPLTTDDWLEILSAAEYKHSISDPLINSLLLVRSKRDHKLDFKLIENMKPLLKAILIGQYAFGLNISKDKLKSVYEKHDDLSFLSACLLYGSDPDDTSPVWLTKSLLERFFSSHWDTVGKFVFFHAFGLSFRNKNENKLYEQLRDLSHTILLKKIKVDNLKTVNWINKLDFPNDFIAFFSWISLYNIELTEIQESNTIAITNQIVNELKNKAASIPNYLASENGSNPFNSYQLHEAKYHVALAYQLLFLLSANERNKKDIKNSCYEFKKLFYGGYKANILARDFTELMILICLSGNNINGLDDNHYRKIKDLLEIISDTILIPYIHLIERESEIWDSEGLKKTHHYNSGRHLVIKAISKIRKNENAIHYEPFFKIIDETAVANWN